MITGMRFLMVFTASLMIQDALAQTCATVPVTGTGSGYKCKSENAMCTVITDSATKHGKGGKCKTHREISDYVCDCVGSGPATEHKPTYDKQQSNTQPR